jgi:hypothetical protein
MNGAMPSRSRISKSVGKIRPTPPRSWAVTLIKNRGVFLGFVEAPEKQGRAPNYNQSSAVTEVMRLRKSSLLFLPCVCHNAEFCIWYGIIRQTIVWDECSALGPTHYPNQWTRIEV